MAMCVMAVVGVAPCQCFSPGANQITSPGRISSIGPPQRWTRPRPAVTIRVWPSGWVCHAVRAPGSNVTLTPTTRAGSGASNRGSMRTAPVKYSVGPFPEGCEPLLLMSICCIPPFCIVLVTKRVNSVSHVVRCSGQPAAPQRVALVRHGVGVAVGQGGRQVTVGVDLGEHVLGLLLDDLDGVGAGDPAQRRLVLARELDQRLGELGGVTALLAVHALPGGDGLLGSLGVVVDRRLGVVRRLLREQLGAEEAGFDEHRADAERRDLGGQRLDPALDAELRRGVGRDELLSGDTGSRGDRHDEPRALGAHDGQHGAGDVHRAEQEDLDLCPEVLRGDLLEEPGIEVACVVDEDVDVAKAVDGCLHRCLGILGVGDVELDNQQVVGLADGLGDSIGVAASCDDRVPGGQSGLGDMYAHSTACAGNKPNFLLSHRTSSFTSLYRHEKLQEPTRSLFSPIMFSYFLIPSPLHFLLYVWQVSYLLTARSPLKKSPACGAQAERYVLCLVLV